jgi:hypothetical protein
VKQLEAENRRLQRKLQRAETIITLQKMVMRLRCTHDGMKVVASAARASRAEVDAYWCARAREKMDPSATPKAPRLVAFVREEHAR